MSTDSPVKPLLITQERVGNILLIGGASRSGKNYCLRRFLHLPNAKLFDYDNTKYLSAKLGDFDITTGLGNMSVHRYVRIKGTHYKRVMLSLADPTKTVYTNLVLLETFSYLALQKYVRSLEGFGWDMSKVHFVYVYTEDIFPKMTTEHPVCYVPENVQKQSESHHKSFRNNILQYAREHIHGKKYILYNKKNSDVPRFQEI